ncbi:MAG: aldehyde dehydrogenase family protein, partial [Planctomycetota bacterium]
MTHSALRHAPSDLIAGEHRRLSGDAMRSINPALPEETIWQGSPVLSNVDDAVAAARAALPQWSAWPEAQRFGALRRLQELLAERKDDIASLICDETGKALWDSAGEAGILAGKIDISLERSSNSGMARVTGFETGLTETRVGRCWFRPHGVMSVIGPFNFPAHLPNGHMVPALAMGNTVVLKPSDKTPAVG